MNIKSIGTYVLGGLMATSVTGCKQSFKEASHVAPQVAEKLDSISKSSMEILEDKSYRLFGKDTLKLNADFTKNTQKFVDDMNKTAEDSIPKSVIDSKFILVRTPFGSEAKNHIITEPKYKEAKAVITSPKVFEKGGEQYVPVEYYGK